MSPRSTRSSPPRTAARRRAWRSSACSALPPRRARVLTVALDDPDGTLGALQARLSAALAQAGLYTPETRPFRPHVTVARLRPRQRAPRATPDVEPREFHGSAVTLYRSTTHPTGARYEPLARASLR